MNDSLRRDTLETVDQRRVPTLFLRVPVVRRHSPLAPEERFFVVAAVAAGLAVLTFIVSATWPRDTPTERKRFTVAPRPPPPPPAPALTPTDSPDPRLEVDPRWHQLDTFAVHPPDVPTDPLHRYVVSVTQAPRGARLGARLEQARQGFGPLLGLSAGRPLSLRGATGLRLHCEPPERFGDDTRVDVTVLDATDGSSRVVTLLPSRDCFDFSAGRVLRVDDARRVRLAPDPRSRARLAWLSRPPSGAMRAGMLEPGQSMLVEPGVIQFAVVSHTVSDAASFYVEAMPIDVSVEPPPAPRVAPVPLPKELPEVWPRLP